MAVADRAQLIAELTLDDKFTKPLARIDKRMGAFSGAVNRNLSRGIDTAVTKIGRAVVDVSKGVVNAAIDWEDAFTGVTKTIDETGETSFAEISEGLRKMSTEMPNTALELAAIAEAGGAMGISADDIEKFTKQVAILASTTDVSAEDAATALGQLQNVIGLTGDEFDNFAATLVELGNEGSSTESQILEIAKRSGGAATQFGLAEDAVLGFSAAAANLGIGSELAGTNLSKFYTVLQKSFLKGGATISKVTGKTSKELKRAFEKDPEKAVQSFLRSISKLKGAERIEAIEQIFGNRAEMRRLVNGLADSLDKNLNPALEDSARAWEESSAAQEEFDKRNATVKSSIQRLRNVVTDLAVTVGEGVAPALGRAASKLADFLKVPENRDALKRIGQDIGRIIDDVDWQALIGYAKQFMGALDKTAGFAKNLWDAFSAIPSDAKAVLISLAGLNKLSGGAVTGIISNAFKGIGDQFFARGSSPANPMFVSGTGIPGAGANTPGGLLGLLKGFILPVAVATIAAEAWQGLSAQIALALGGGDENKQGFFERALEQIGTTLNPIGSFLINTDKLFGNLDKIPGELEQIAIAVGLLKPPKPTPVGAGLKGPPGGGGGIPNRPGGPGGGARSQKELKDAIIGTKNATSQAGDKTSEAMGTVDDSVIRNREAIHASKQAQVTAVQTGTLNVTSQTRSSGNGIAQTSITNANRIISGMKGLPPPIVNVDVDVSATTVRQTTTITNRTGATGGSAANDERHYG